MSTPVDPSELRDAFAWVSAAGPGQNAAYVCLRSGRIFWQTDGSLGDLEEELPEDVEDAGLYVPVPHKYRLDLGQELVFRFVEENIPDAWDEVRRMFQRRGGYARLKDFLLRRRLLDAWHAYEEQAIEAALREWAEANDLEVVGSSR